MYEYHGNKGSRRQQEIKKPLTLYRAGGFLFISCRRYQTDHLQIYSGGVRILNVQLEREETETTPEPEEPETPEESETPQQPEDEDSATEDSQQTAENVDVAQNAENAKQEEGAKEKKS